MFRALLALSRKQNVPVKTAQLLCCGFQPPAHEGRCICFTSIMWPWDEAVLNVRHLCMFTDPDSLLNRLNVAFWLMHHKSLTVLWRAS